MNNTEIKKFMAEKISGGISLSDLQKMVNDKFKTKYTFMDIRVLASELEDIDWTTEKERKEAEKLAQEETNPPVAEAPPAVPADAAGKTVIEINKIVRPGMMFSGKVEFGSGASADWYVDGSGRLGLDNLQGQPTPEDVKEFQAELQKSLA